jgi:hypothetical protein
MAAERVIAGALGDAHVKAQMLLVEVEDLLAERPPGGLAAA